MCRDESSGGKDGQRRLADSLCLRGESRDLKGPRGVNKPADKYGILLTLVIREWSFNLVIGH
jgi:hypothetical protein